MSKRFREAFKETICRCRWKRTLVTRPNNVYQTAYYFTTKPERLPQRATTRRSDHSATKSVMRSDTLQTQVSFAMNGTSNRDAEEQITERLLHENGDTSS